MSSFSVGTLQLQISIRLRGLLYLSVTTVSSLWPFMVMWLTQEGESYVPTNNFFHLFGPIIS